MVGIIEKLKSKYSDINNNRGVAVVEVILILVVLIGLVIIFKSQATSLVGKIWDAISENSSSITG